MAQKYWDEAWAETGEEVRRMLRTESREEVIRDLKDELKLRWRGMEGEYT